MKEQILKLRSEGKTYNQIREELECSKGTIAYHCGEGQKEKSYIRTKKSRKNPQVFLNYVLNRKYKNIFVRDAKKNKNIKRHREETNFSLSDFKNHILKNSICYISGEKLNLENVSTWEIDHIIPCDIFDFSLLEEQQKCIHYTNTQPLFKTENRQKYNKINQINNE